MSATSELTTRMERLQLSWRAPQTRAVDLRLRAYGRARTIGSLKEALRKLCEISSAPLGAPAASSQLDGLPAALSALLSVKNGFIAFEGALLVLPASDGTLPGLQTWNELEGWRRHYPDVVVGTVFFAMDVFACQFGLDHEQVVKLEPETGEVSTHAADLESWARVVLDDYSFETGWPLAREWQLKNRRLAIDERLLPRQPFVAGGDYVVDNLVAMPLVQAMEKLGSFSELIRGVPDGSTVTLKNWI